MIATISLFSRNEWLDSKVNNLTQSFAVNFQRIVVIMDTHPRREQPRIVCCLMDVPVSTECECIVFRCLIILLAK